MKRILKITLNIFIYLTIWWLQMVMILGILIGLGLYGGIGTVSGTPGIVGLLCFYTSYVILKKINKIQFITNFFTQTKTKDKKIKRNQIKNVNEYYSNGCIKIEGTLKGNLKEGLWKYYYEDGKLSNEGRYINNIREGNWKFYSENGVLISKMKFKNGKQVKSTSKKSISNGKKIFVFVIIFFLSYFITKELIWRIML